MTNVIINIAIGLSVALNAIFIAIVILVLSGRAMKYMMSLFVKPTYERWTSQFEILRVQPVDTVFLGDSITEGGNWHELFPLSNVRNRGIGGDVTTGVIARLDQITEGQPAQVFLMIGINDLAGKTKQEDIVANIIKIIEAIQEASPQTSVFVQSVLPTSASVQKRNEAFNAALKKAIAERASWVDLYPLFLDEAGQAIDGSLSNDKLHLTGEGYLVWRNAIAPLVNRRDSQTLDSPSLHQQTVEPQRYVDKGREKGSVAITL